MLILVTGLPVRMLIGYLNSYQYSLDKRRAISEQDKKNINIAIIWSMAEQNSFINGVKLAIKEENNKGITIKEEGKSYDLTLIAKYYDDSTAHNNQLSIQKIINNKNITVVIGHSSSINATTASVSYEQYGLLFLSPVATDQSLTNHGFKYVFSTIPIDLEYAQALVKFTEQQEYRKVAVFYSRNGSYGLNLYNNYRSLLYGKNIEIVFSRSFNSEQADYLKLIYDMPKTKPDVILLGATEKNAANFIKQLRTLGIQKPIISGDGIDNPFIWQISDKKAYNTYVASIYIDNPYSANKHIDPNFYHNFFEQYAYAPDYLALQGYDAIKILTAAIRRSNSKNPLILSATLKYNFNGAYNNYHFNSMGRILNKNIFIKEMKQGAFYEFKKEN